MRHTPEPSPLLVADRPGLRPCGAAALAVLLCGFHAGFAATPAAAADAPTVTEPAEPEPAPALANRWSVKVALYGWAAGMNGDTSIGRLPSASIDASFSDILQNLDGALMGAVFVTDGAWTFYGDLVLSRLSRDSTVGRLGNGALSLSMDQTIVTIAGGHMLPLGIDNLEVAATVGARYLNLTAGLDLSAKNHPANFSRNRTFDWVDPTVGMTATWHVDEHWLVNAIADIGGFGVGSNLSSQGYLGLGYQWNEHVITAVGYKYLYEDYDDPGVFSLNTVMHGPTVSLAYQF